MTFVNLATVILLGEIAAASSIALFTFAFIMWIKHRRAKRALFNLVASIKKNSSDRNATIDVWLRETCHFDVDKASTISSELQKIELQFYKQLIVALFTKNVNAITSIFHNVDKFTTAYRSIIASISGLTTSQPQDAINPVITELTTQIGILTTELEGMRKTNETLTLRISQQQDEMTQMLKEYSSAFRSISPTPTPAERSIDDVKIEPLVASQINDATLVVHSSISSDDNHIRGDSKNEVALSKNQIAEIPEILLDDMDIKQLDPDQIKADDFASATAPTSQQTAYPNGVLAQDDVDLTMFNAGNSTTSHPSPIDPLDQLLATFGEGATPAPAVDISNKLPAPDIDELLNSASAKSAPSS